MPTRFYLPAEGSGAPTVSPAFDSNWEQTGQATRLRLRYKQTVSTVSTLADTGTRTVPITTTQDILGTQFVSDPIPAQTIRGQCSLVIRTIESTVDANVTLAVVLRLMSNDGATSRGTLFSVFGTGTEYAVTAATRIVASSNVTSFTAQPGDRLVLEVGARATTPVSAQTYTHRLGHSAATDFALTAALTTDLNPWLELSQDLFKGATNWENGRSFGVAASGVSVTERTRTWG
jgi:hypothetical protein